MNKPKPNAANTVYGAIVFPFNEIIVNVSFFLLRCKYSRIKLCYIKFQFVKQTQIKNVSNTEKLFNNNNNNNNNNNKKYPQTKK